MKIAYLTEEDTKLYTFLNLIYCKGLFKITFICLYPSIATAIRQWIAYRFKDFMQTKYANSTASCT